MSNKIRLAGLVITAVVLIAGIIGMSVAASANIGEVDSLKAESITENSAELQWKKVGSADSFFVILGFTSCLKVSTISSLSLSLTAPISIISFIKPLLT